MLAIHTQALPRYRMPIDTNESASQYNDQSKQHEHEYRELIFAMFVGMGSTSLLPMLRFAQLRQLSLPGLTIGRLIMGKDIAGLTIGSFSKLPAIWAIKSMVFSIFGKAAQEINYLRGRLKKQLTDKSVQSVEHKAERVRLKNEAESLKIEISKLKNEAVSLKR